MSYVRFGVANSDVYVYGSTDHKSVCCMCTLRGGDDAVLDTRDEMLNHLERHLDIGDTVPQFVFDELLWEIRAGYEEAEEGDEPTDIEEVREWMEEER